jgi:hypothetical protein
LYYIPENRTDSIFPKGLIKIQESMTNEYPASCWWRKHSSNVWGNIDAGPSVIQNADNFNHPVNLAF